MIPARPLLVVVLAIAFSAVLLTAPGRHDPPVQAQVTTELVSVAPDGSPADAAAVGAVISANGRFVAFASGAENLDAEETEGMNHVYLRDRLDGTTRRITMGLGGAVADGDSSADAISADGRIVVFTSFAGNLVAGDSNEEADVFAYDRQSGRITRVSVSTDGAQASAGAAGGAVSADGRTVAFDSASPELVVGDTNDVRDVFVHVRATGVTTRVSVRSDGAEVLASSEGPSLSRDGRLVAFSSESGRLVPGDVNGFPDVFLHDRSAGTTALVSVASDGTPGDDVSEDAVVSADGTVVAFASLAVDLDNANTIWRGIFTRDVAAGETERESVSSSGELANGNSEAVSVSGTGRYVAYESAADSLVPGDTNTVEDVFVRDREDGTTERVSLTSAGEQADRASRRPAVSADGRFVAFDTAAALVPGVSPGVRQVYVRDRIGGPIPTPTQPPSYARLPWAGRDASPGEPTATTAPPTPTRPSPTPAGTATPTVRPSRTPRMSPTPEISGTPRVTATPKASPTPGPMVCADVITNGDFSNGLNDWTFDGEVSLKPDDNGEGRWTAMLLGRNSVTASLTQSVTVPEDAVAAYLTYWWRIESDESPSADEAYDTSTLVTGRAGGQDATWETLSNLGARDEWRLSGYDVMGGRPLRVGFESVANPRDPTEFYLDDVQLVVCTGQPPPMPELAVDPGSGNTDTTFTGSGTGFGADEPVSRWLLEPTNMLRLDLEEGAADAAGAFSMPFTVGGAPGGWRFGAVGHSARLPAVKPFTVSEAASAP